MGIDRAVLFRLATSERFERAVRTLPGGEAGTWRAARRYVAGRTRDEALATTAEVLHRGHGASVDLFGELVRTPEVGDRVVDDYRRLAAALPPPPSDTWLSVDLTHLALDVDPVGTADRLAAIAAALPAERRVQVGAEDAGRTDAVLGCVLAVADRGLAGRLGATVQANLERSPGDVDALAGTGVHVRLVKGAYLDPTGTHPHGEPTDVAYLHLAARLARSGVPWSAATHDRRLQEALLLQHGPVPVEQLLGVRPAVLDELARRGIPTRVYVPYGPDWFRYWMRRVAESRGA
ncbi:proline dehydrogenase [Geodermatophilus sp. TF02-6]|uniref:proline dehydrogenase family protein n=1 Tax=Geodermatophilus sp. TF02-6 TaxID=2250575 RepID=UPI000DE95973|nr:proline dehydrogenase family protein [Geodermatophilus sp. TF02-6]RBY80839.1 proline dehydrogenase [Geodermatophilus sp. TF02-6]